MKKILIISALLLGASFVQAKGKVPVNNIKGVYAQSVVCSGVVIKDENGVDTETLESVVFFFSIQDFLSTDGYAYKKLDALVYSKPDTNTNDGIIVTISVKDVLISKSGKNIKFSSFYDVNGSIGEKFTIDTEKNFISAINQAGKAVKHKASCKFILNDHYTK
ncbi:MAG: hypothetical protein HAW60_03020 [Bdellovibrionales bacterium]|nr:hypothetical protein [Bdellovibrionales bacterium]